MFDDLYNKLEEEEIEVGQSIDTRINQEFLEMSIGAALIENHGIEGFRAMMENGEIDKMVEMGLLSEKTIVKLDKDAKLSKAYSVAVLNLAKAENDPLFVKFVNVKKMEKNLKGKMEKKYGNKAKKIAKESVNKTKKKKK